MFQPRIRWAPLTVDLCPSIRSRRPRSSCSGARPTASTCRSGGERSLAALAFLFAIFDARPSPFYVLDEVEAALDDANLRRFLRVVDEFRQRAQLIIITHQQQTMEAADVLYGVTMEPGGSSKAIRKDMRDAIVSESLARP